MASSMETLEELLPDIDNFLRNVLKKEKLSSLAEKKRVYYVGRLDVYFTPPDLPPRPDDQPATESNDFLAQQRALSRANATPAIKDTTTSKVPPEEYCDMKQSSKLYSDDELYEIPEDTVDKQRSSGSWTDGTSYESYDEDEEITTREVVYENQILSQEVRLPSVKGKELNVKPDKLPDVTMSGELSQRGTLSWPHRHCVISQHNLCVYKTVKDSKPVLVIPLLGYDALYLERENKRSYVIRLAQPAHTTHWFCASSGESAQLWVEHLNTAARDTDVITDECAEETSGGSFTTQCTTGTERSAVSQSQSNLSSVSSEGSSGDGIVQAVSDREKKLKKEDSGTDKKKFSLQNFLTFGKKKGDKAIKRLTLKDTETDTTMAGHLNIRSETVANGAWQSLWCVIKQGCLECFREVGDDTPVLSLLLTGMTIENAAPSTKRELSLMLLQFRKEMLCLEASDPLDHGRWLNVLIKQTAPVPPAFSLASVSETDSVNSDIVYSDVYEDIPTDSSKVTQNAVTVDGANKDEDAETYDDVELEPPTTDDGNGDEKEDAETYDDVELEPPTTDDGNGDEKEDAETYDDVELEPPTTARLGGDVTSTAGHPPLPNNPPPLPNNPPPIDRLLRRKASQNEDMSEAGIKRGGLNFEQEMTAKFSEIQSQYKLSMTGSDDVSVCSRDTCSSHDTHSSRDSGVSMGIQHETGSNMVNSKAQCEETVIKGYTGGCLSQDREILECAENPILGELRRGRLGGGSVQEKRQRQEEIERLRDKATFIRKNRQQVRGRKLAADNPAEKRKLEDELEKLDIDLEETECRLTKLQFLVQDKDSSRSHKDNLKSPLKNKSSHSTTSATRAIKVTTTTTSVRRLNNKSPQKKQQAVSVVSKCITSKAVTTVQPYRKTDTCASSKVARSDRLAALRSPTKKNDATKTQSGGKTSTVQQKLKLWESISDSSTTC